MPAPDIHARSHLPGGTDPITLSGGGLKWAVASYGQQSHSISSSRIRMRFNWLETNDLDLFSLDTLSSDTIRGGAAQWADYLAVSGDGYYHIFSQVNTAVNNAFNTFDTWLESLTQVSGVDSLLINSADLGQWYNGLQPGGEMYAASEWRHQGMSHLHGLWYAGATWDGGSPMRLGMRVHTAKTGSVTIGCQMMVIQIAPVATGAYAEDDIS